MKTLFALVLFSPLGFSQVSSCDLADYKPSDGLTATARRHSVEFEWDGERGQQLRASFASESQTPVVKELAARKSGGGWIVLGKNLVPGV